MHFIKLKYYRLLLVVFCSPIFSYAQTDLSIGNDAKTDRPNVFIAWRNTDRILEVEIEAINSGNIQAEGSLRLSILDEEGNLLDESPKGEQPDITIGLPPANRGGDEGKIVQMHGTKELNLLIDRLDRNNSRYRMRVDFVSDSEDANPLNNTVFKTFNVDAKLRQNSAHTFEYFLQNAHSEGREVTLDISMSNLPKDWHFEAEPANGTSLWMEPGEVFQGTARLKTPGNLQNGDHLDVRFSAVDMEQKQVIDGAEWYAVYDTMDPQITDLEYAINEETGNVRVYVAAVDNDSMIKEASGVRVEYSTDGGTTYSNRVMAYLDGNFVGPTRFQTDLGPFAQGTNLSMSVIVEDISGNKTEHTFPQLTLRSENRLGISQAAID